MLSEYDKNYHHTKISQIYPHWNVRLYSAYSNRLDVTT